MATVHNSFEIDSQDTRLERKWEKNYYSSPSRCVFIAKRAVAVDDSAEVAHEQSIRTPRLSIVPFPLLTWFPYSKNGNVDSDSNRQQHRPTYLFFRESVVNEIMKLETNTLVGVYAKFSKLCGIKVKVSISYPNP